MRLELDVRRIEHVISQKLDPTFTGDQFDYTAFGGRLRYEGLVPVDPLNPDCPHLLDVSDFSATVRACYGDTMRTPGYIASGMFEFSDFGFFGPCALPIDI